MSTVFFLFLLHLSVGLLATLPLVPERAGAKFFKFCSAAAVFMTTAGLWLLYRRFGIEDGPATLGEYRVTFGAAAASLLFAVLYNRAQHFAWRAARLPLLGASLAAGIASMVSAAPPAERGLVLAAALTSAVLLGAAFSAMVLGHWYLVVLDLPIVALRRLTVLLAAGLAARALMVGIALFAVAGAHDAAAAVAAGRWDNDGVFVWMRLLFGIAGPLSLIGFVWKTVEIRSTQSATGILYVQLFLVMSGELLATYLRVSAGFPPVKALEIAFACSGCRAEVVSVAGAPATCARCGAVSALDLPEAVRRGEKVESCPACGGRQLYVQRDFNQKAGLAVVIVGAALAPFTPFYSSLIVAALVDAGLYAMLPEITVCYRCHAHFRGFARNPAHEAFDLHLAEQYETHERSGRA